MRSILALIIGICFIASLSGCHATSGFGQDVQDTGKNIKQGVHKTNRAVDNATSNY